MRFIHLADVHLGAVPDRGFAWSARREEEIWETFRRVIAVIRNDPVDLLFIAGDLFHRQPLAAALREVAELFAGIPDTRVYVMAGNHDYLKKDSAYLKTAWPENVCFFTSQEPQRVEDPELPVYVYGLSYESSQISEDIYQGLMPWTDNEEEEAFHILLAHGGDADHVPLNVRSLAAAGFDYIALGHIHRPQILITDRAAYSGALEPIDRNDTGAHGYMLGWTQNGRLRVKFVPFAERNYEIISLNVSLEDTQTSLEEKLREQIHQLGAGNLYIIRLQGERAPDLVLLTDRMKRLGNILDIQDQTRPHYELDELLRCYRGTIIGDYILSFNSLENDRRSPVEEQALYYGLQALLETARFS